MVHFFGFFACGNCDQYKRCACRYTIQGRDLLLYSRRRRFRAIATNGLLFRKPKHQFNTGQHSAHNYHDKPSQWHSRNRVSEDLDINWRTSALYMVHFFGFFAVRDCDQYKRRTLRYSIEEWDLLLYARRSRFQSVATNCILFGELEH